MRFRLVDKRLKVVQSDTPEVGDGKENSLNIFGKFPFASTEMDLTLKYKGSKFIRAATTEQVRFSDPFGPFFWL